MTTDVGTTTTYFVGTHYEVTGSEITKYYYAGSQRIAMRKNGALNYIIGDHLGSTSLVTDASGSIINQTQYKAWGEERYSSGTKQTGYGYTGQYSYAADFGLHYYNARWYDSSLGRFAQADTIVPGGVQGYDRYAYTNNSPLNYVDPSGHEPKYGDGACYGINCTNANGTVVAPGNGQSSTPPRSAGYASGVYRSTDEQLSPTWEMQMDQNIWGMASNPLGLPYYYAQYSYPNGGKQGQANTLAAANSNSSAPTLCIGMSAGADSCVLYAIDRLNQGLQTTHLVLIGGTFNSTARPGFSSWEVDLKRLLDSGTRVLVVNDASIFGTKGDDDPHETFKYYGYTLAQVPFSQEKYLGSVLPHHTDTCKCNIAANNSATLATSIYDWINTGSWSWKP